MVHRPKGKSPYKPKKKNMVLTEDYRMDIIDQYEKARVVRNDNGEEVIEYPESSDAPSWVLPSLPEVKQLVQDMYQEMKRLDAPIKSKYRGQEVFTPKEGRSVVEQLVEHHMPMRAAVGDTVFANGESLRRSLLVEEAIEVLQLNGFIGNQIPLYPKEQLYRETLRYLSPEVYGFDDKHPLVVTMADQIIDAAIEEDGVLTVERISSGSLVRVGNEKWWGSASFEESLVVTAAITLLGVKQLLRYRDFYENIDLFEPSVLAYKEHKQAVDAA